MLRLSRLTFNVTGAVVALGTASAIEGALVVSACIGVSGMTTLLCFLVLEGSALAPVATHHLRAWVHHRRRIRREREHAAELVAALNRPEYAARVQREVFEPRMNMSADTVVLERVRDEPRGTVYCTTHELDDPLTMRILAELTEHTGDIPRSA